MAHQFSEGCKLSLPDGLKELMYDISREVLRAQPHDLYGFIAKYLSALLVTRENLFLSSRICCDICDNTCNPEILEELKAIGLDDKDAETVKDLANTYFMNDKAKEVTILQKILQNTGVDEKMLPGIQTAIRKAFLRHHTANNDYEETSSNSSVDEVDTAVRHTLNLYKQTKPQDEIFKQMATRIQNSYKAYGVRKKSKNPKKNDTKYEVEGKKIRFLCNSEKKEVFKEPFRFQQKLGSISVSSLSLAGSYLNLPTHKPYSIQDSDLMDIEETTEKNIDYVADYATKRKEKEIDADILDVSVEDVEKESGILEECLDDAAESEKDKENEVGILEDCQKDTEESTKEKENEVGSLKDLLKKASESKNEKEIVVDILKDYKGNIAETSKENVNEVDILEDYPDDNAQSKVEKENKESVIEDYVDDITESKKKNETGEGILEDYAENVEDFATYADDESDDSVVDGSLN